MYLIINFKRHFCIKESVSTFGTMDFEEISLLGSLQCKCILSLPVFETAILDLVTVYRSTSQASSYNPRWQHWKPALSNVPFQNNTSTAGYLLGQQGCYKVLKQTAVLSLLG